MLKVVPLYESNYREIDATLDLLKEDCQRDGVKSVVTVCMRKGDIDVRGMGAAGMADVLVLLTTAQQFIMDVMRQKLEHESC